MIPDGIATTSDLTKGEAPVLSPLLRSGPYRLETLKSRQLFKDAAAGPRFSTPAFTMLRRPANAGEARQIAACLRFGFTVTKKIGGAVERNRIRRRLKAAVQAAWPHFQPASMDAGCLDLVILARKEAMTIAFPDLVRDIARSVIALAQRGNARNQRVKLGKPTGPD